MIGPSSMYIACVRNSHLPHSIRLRSPLRPCGEESRTEPWCCVAASAKGPLRIAYSLYNPPKSKGDFGPSLDGQDLQVPRNREGVHPGLAARPRTPGPHPLPGGFNETAFESNLIRGLLVVQIHLVSLCDFP